MFKLLWKFFSLASKCLYTDQWPLDARRSTGKSTWGHGTAKTKQPGDACRLELAKVNIIQWKFAISGRICVPVGPGRLVCHTDNLTSASRYSASRTGTVSDVYGTSPPSDSIRPTPGKLPWETSERRPVRLVRHKKHRHSVLTRTARGRRRLSLPTRRNYSRKARVMTDLRTEPIDGIRRDDACLLWWHLIDWHLCREPLFAVCTYKIIWNTVPYFF